MNEPLPRELPPRKELPDDVRDRLRATVNAKLDKPRPIRSHGPLAVAAGVALLAAAAVLVGQAVNGAPEHLPPGNVIPTDELLDEATMNAALDRCVPVMGKSKDMPAPEDWRPVIGQRTMTEGVVVAARAGDAYLACQTTPSAVSVYYSVFSFERDLKPPYLLSDTDGVIVGVADPTWGRVGVYVTGKDFVLSHVAATKDGVFVLNAEIPVQDPEIRIYRADEGEGLPPVDDMTPVKMLVGGVSTIDRPNVVTEADKQILSSCVAATPDLVGNWTPGAAITRDGNRFLLARDGARIAMCVQHAQPVDGREYTLTDLGTHTSQGFAPCPIPGATADGSLTAAVVAPEATNVELDYGPYEIVHGAVTNGTYLAPSVGGKAPAWAVVYTKDSMRYNGPPTC